MSKKLGVFLLSYKRPEYVQQAIESILIQNYHDFDLIVSENTPDDSVMGVLEKYKADVRFRIVKRNPSLPALTHFNAVIAEAGEYEFAMLFHDDDLLMQNALSKMVHALETHPSYSAASCNAYILKNDEFTKIIFNPKLNGESSINSQSELISRYIFKQLSHTPFPSYIFRTSNLQNLQLDLKDGGKYSDVSFLVKLIKRGPFIWLGEPLMRYRQHSSNDSVDLNLRDIFSLSLFFFGTCPGMFLQILFYYSKQVLKKILMALK